MLSAKVIGNYQGDSEEFTIHYYDNQLYERLRESLSLSDVEHVKVFKNDTEVMTIFVYDVVNDEWLFRLDHHIRLPKIIYIFIL